MKTFRLALPALLSFSLLITAPLTPQTKSGWSEPVEIYYQKDRKKVPALFPLGMHADGNNLDVLYVSVRRDRAGKRENAEFTMARSSNGGKDWKYVAAALESQGLINMSKPVFHDGFWHIVLQQEGPAPIYASIHPPTGVSEATPIRILGKPRMSRFVMPTLRVHNGKFYTLFASDEKSSPANRVYLLESADGKSWNNIAPEGWRHYSMRSGRPVLYTTRALLHVLIQEHLDGWQYSHYQRFDAGSGPWNRVRVQGHESLTTYPFAAEHSRNKTVLIDGYQWAGKTPDYTLRAHTLDGAGALRGGPTVIAPRVLKIWNEWTNLHAHNGRFMVLSENRLESPPGAGLYALYSADGESWRNIAFRPAEGTVQVHATGTFSRTGDAFHMVYVDVKGKYEEGTLRFMYRRWTP